MLITKSVVGCATCSLLTEKPHPVNASTISGTDMDGNQNCPAIIRIVFSLNKIGEGGAREEGEGGGEHPGAELDHRGATRRSPD